MNDMETQMCKAGKLEPERYDVALMTPKRKYMNEYTDAARQIELAGIAIYVLGKMRGNTPQRLIKSLQYEQQRAIKRFDAMAAQRAAV